MRNTVTYFKQIMYLNVYILTLITTIHGYEQHNKFSIHLFTGIIENILNKIY